PVDGAMYFIVGGRKTQSGLYRVTYVGKESTAASKGSDAGAKERQVRHSIEAYHKKDDKAVAFVWPYLDHEDRYVRFAARVALEHQDADGWKDKALKEKTPGKALTAMLALVRVSASCPQHAKTEVAKPEVDAKLKSTIFDRLVRLGDEKLTDEQRLDL